AGNAEKVLLRLDLQQAEPLAVARPDELPRRRVPAHSDAVGSLDQYRAARPDLPDDLGIDRRIAAVLPVRAARVNVHHRGTRFPAARGGLPDFVRLLGYDRALAVLLHAAVESDRDHHLVAVQHRPRLRFPSRSGPDRSPGLSYRERTVHSVQALTAGERPMADIWRVTDWRLPDAIGPAYHML